MLEQGQPAFVTFSPAEIGQAQAIGDANYDAVVYEMEHGPYDIRLLRDCLQYMLNRRQIVQSGDVAPAVVFLVSSDSAWTTGVTLEVSGGVA